MVNWYGTNAHQIDYYREEHMVVTGIRAVLKIGKIIAVGPFQAF